ncbi:MULTISPECIES: DUF1573 domain-containing protein [unclassified Aureispira]|uniref:DUF1573 domain-containing protein n=1 Tax=unclassified Aureispira TaxID=2649989 RepID=UPI0009DED140|nr:MULTISPECIES: DUF1573 domain-containing protein [unclassified Aureispira]WMX16408.1 DUF1573 domain-containing protein [Aureispira sp. CCB-E]
MKKIFSLFAVLLVAVSFASAQEITFSNYAAGDCTKASSAAEKEGAQMDQPGTTATEWNYGNIKNASTGYRYFKFTNTGSGPLVISAAKGSCGCTVPSYPKEPIMPGESEFIKVKYDTKRTGAFTKYVTLTTNAQTNTTTRLKIFGTVDAPANTPAPALKEQPQG